MLLLDKARALDRMVWLSGRKSNAVPPEFQHSSPLRWTVAPDGGRSLAGEAALCQPSVLDPAFRSPDALVSMRGATSGIVESALDAVTD